MSEQAIPMTTAVRLLKENSIQFEPAFYEYEEKGGTTVSSRELGVDEHVVIKTLIMEDDNKKPMIVLMHGDRQVSTKQLARELGVKSVKPCEPDVANRHSGYVVGGTSPFATKKQMNVIMQKTIAELDFIFINGGKKGFLVKVATADVIKILQ
ncbi:MAG: aminoacyl-tRNA deacylase, partial [Bdellovibrionaceae bacterium]|nr:aminoacyl-tRNA deacylase [Pseudobdellovibrionaceae bacterium]